jgi:hypothetical protein
MVDVSVERYFDRDGSIRDALRSIMGLFTAPLAGCLLFECSVPNAIIHGIPGSTVVRIPNADHYVHRSNEAQVVEEMKKFLATLR